MENLESKINNLPKIEDVCFVCDQERDLCQKCKYCDRRACKWCFDTFRFMGKLKCEDCRVDKMIAENKSKVGFEKPLITEPIIVQTVKFKDSNEKDLGKISDQPLRVILHSVVCDNFALYKKDKTHNSLHSIRTFLTNDMKMEMGQGRCGIMDDLAVKQIEDFIDDPFSDDAYAYLLLLIIGKYPPLLDECGFCEESTIKPANFMFMASSPPPPKSPWLDGEKIDKSVMKKTSKMMDKIKMPYKEYDVGETNPMEEVD
jgi:hypothetical protein